MVPLRLNQLLVKGGVLYRDGWDVKGPVALLPFILAQSVFGHNMWGIRVLDLLIRLVNLAALGVIAQRFWDRKTAEYAAVLFALFATWLNFSMIAQPDEWCGCAIAIVVAMISTSEREIPLPIIGVGSFLIGLCSLENPIYAISVPICISSLHPLRVHARVIAAREEAYL